MQSYLQYRRLGNVVRSQLENASPVKEASTPADSETGPVANPDRINHESAPGQIPLARRASWGSSRTALAYSIAGIDVKKQSESTDQPAHLFIFGWDGPHDPENPLNYSFASRLTATLLVSALGFIVGAASSINSGVLTQNIEAFHVSEVVGSLVTGLYLLGFAAGSLVSGPLSEILGRNAVYAGSLTLFMIFIMGSALAPNIGAQLAFRFLAGTMYFPLYAVLSFGGPVLGPVIASYMGQTGVLSWRWTAWIILVASGAIFVLIILFQPETYSPLLLKWKGKQLCKITGDPRFRSEMDMEKIALFSRIGGAMERQFLITIHEPIILLISLYMTVLYIVLFTFFDGYTYIFSEMHGLSQGLTNIVWGAMYIGILLSGLLLPVIYRGTKEEFTRAAEVVNGSDPTVDPRALDGVHTQPEIRLWFAMVGAPFIPISLFWMGWTDFPSISVWSPIIATSAFGFGTICVFISSYMYVIDSYGIYAASALGFMTVSRYCAAGGMTIVGIPFYKNMGVHWTLTILGCISALMVPVPYVFYKFGPVIRRWSRYAMTEDVKV
ncbi:uncharacterized protein N7477_006658 [Penicillium maclennaniae]|uniref:uncharacterized protein n=1 Tax=Penicillium maclennaniae TaxID=1343394 RepID=UPI00254072F5|nr:uncharacterized protein N7477_006658 [Penicillium maclennaniae]KAJ5668088.1 hypothetical protein N7477_006658 [Penicillium maclennaniae]